MRRKFWTLLTYCFLLGFFCFLLTAVSSDGVVLGQSSGETGREQLSVGTLSESRPSVNRLLPDQLTAFNDEIAIAPIYLDGRDLFSLSAIATDGQTTAESPVEARAQEIQQRLNKVAKAYRQQKVAVTITTENSSNLPEIVVGTQRLLTVTTLDVQISGHANTSSRARYLVGVVEDALERYREERQPTFLWAQVRNTAVIAGCALLCQLVLSKIRHRLKRRQKRLANTDTQLGQATQIGHPPMVDLFNVAMGSPMFDLLKARLDNRQKRKLNETGLGLIFFLQVGLWGGSLLLILSLFPYSRWLSTLLRHWIKIPAQILLIAGVAYVALRLSSFAIDKIGLALEEGAQWAPDRTQRLSLRFSTFSQAAKGVAGAVIFGVMLLTMLTVAGVLVGPLLAGAGIAGVGISLAAQSLIKDIINGFLILFEDQFGLGDVIVIEGHTGTVEAINLRITQLRNIQGSLITIPNSQIGIIQNLSKDWSQVDLSFTVTPTTDLTEACCLLQETAAQLAEDADWRRFILEPPDLLGIDNIDHTGVTLRLLLKTQPSKQWLVARELRRRIKFAFDEANIRMGLPQERLELHWQEGAATLKTLET